MASLNFKSKFISFIRKNWNLIVFSLLILFLAWVSGAFRLLSYRPIGEHTWAQVDRAAVALNYYKNEASFFFPQTLRLNENPSGIEPGEFPLIPWLASVLYRIFGFDEFWFRPNVHGNSFPTMASSSASFI